MKWNKTGIYITGSLILGGIVALGIHLFKGKKKKSDKFGNQWVEEDTGLQGGIESNRDNLGAGLIEPNWDNPFDSRFTGEVISWVSPKKVIKLKDDYADKIAQEIRKAKGRFWISNDDEQAIRNIFSKKLKDKVQVANVAQAFFKRYNQDLLSFLKSFLNSSEMKEHVYRPLTNLKNYRTA